MEDVESLSASRFRLPLLHPTALRPVLHDVYSAHMFSLARRRAFPPQRALLHPSCRASISFSHRLHSEPTSSSSSNAAEPADDAEPSDNLDSLLGLDSTPEAPPEESRRLRDFPSDESASTSKRQSPPHTGLQDGDGDVSLPPTGPPGSRPATFPPKKKAPATGTNPFRNDASLDAKKYRLYAHTSENNTILSLQNGIGNTKAWVSGGTCKFTSARRSTYEAGYQCAVSIFKKIEAERKLVPDMTLEVLFKGRGMGRSALQSALVTSEADNIRDIITHVTDRTPVKIGGTRAKKQRKM